MDSLNLNRRQPPAEKPQLELPDSEAWLLRRAAKAIACIRSQQVRDAEYLLCSQDIVHWLTWWGCVYEPRNEPGSQDLPFIPWDFQVKELEFLHQVFSDCSGAQGKKANVLYEKARDMGASWIVLMYFTWDWLFHGSSFLIGSRKEEEVDKPGDMDTPFQKIRYVIGKLPDWMLPEQMAPTDFLKKYSRFMMLRNPLGGEIVGESANPNFGRGGRKKGVLYDELSSWQYDTESWRATSATTNVRIAVYTPNGPNNKAARLRHGEDREECLVRTLYWWLHPLKAQGLDWINGKATSPWYREMERTMSADDLAKEVDISYLNSQRGVVFENYGYGHKDVDLKPVEGKRMIRVWDPGVDFHVLFGQVDSYGRILCHKELHWTDARIDDVARDVLNISATYFPNFEFEDYGDPYGSYRHVSMQQDPEYIYLMQNHGIVVESAFMAKISPKDRIKHRVTAIRQKMSEYVGATQSPGLIINPEECPYLDRALGGGYRRKVDINGNVLEQIDEVHPDEDAVDDLGMLILAKVTHMRGGNTYVPMNVQKRKLNWTRPSRRY